MNAPLPVQHGAFRNEAPDRIDASPTRRKLVVPDVFAASPSNKLSTKVSPSPKKLKIPMAFSSPHTPKTGNRKCSSPAIVKVKVPILEKLDEQPLTTDLQPAELPDVPAEGPGKSLQAEEAVAYSPLEKSGKTQQVKEITKSVGELEFATVRNVEMPPCANGGITVTEKKLASKELSRSLLKTQSKRLRQEKRKQAVEKQKRELMKQLLALNEKIEAAKLHNSSQHLLVEGLEIDNKEVPTVETEPEVNQEEGAGSAGNLAEQVAVIEIIDESSTATQEEEEVAVREVTVGGKPTVDEATVIDPVVRDPHPGSVDPPLESTKTSESASGIQKVGKLNKKRLVRLGSFFVRRRKKESSKSTSSVA